MIHRIKTITLRLLQALLLLNNGGFSTLATNASEVDMYSLSLKELLEIKITAQKRSEPLQSAPLSVNAVDADSIRNSNITRIEELANLVPSLVFEKRHDFTKSSFRIRGIGTLVFGSGVEPSVATVIDGVVMARGGAGLGELPDVERVEVLNGPQGTLFGKNTSAGLIHILTQQPNTHERDARISSTVTEKNEYKVSFNISAPVTSSIAYRVSGYGHKYNGNVDNLFNGETLNGYDTKGVRGKLSWQINDDFRVLLSADHASQDTSYGVRVLRVDSDTVFTDPAAIGASGDPGTAGTITGINGSKDNNKVNLDRSPRVDTEAFGGSVKVRWQREGVELTSITAYREWEQRNNRDNDQTQLAFSLDQRLYRDLSWFSQELRLAGSFSERTDFMFGAYYFYSKAEDTDGDSRTLSNFPYIVEFNRADNVIDNKNAAIFGQLDFHVDDATTVFIGLRYLYDKVAASLARQAFSQNNPYLGNGVVTDTMDVGGINNDKSFNEIIGRAGVNYTFNDRLMAYASYSRGFKSAAFNTSFKFNVDVFLNDEPVDPEYAHALEAGLRSTLFDDRLRLNITMFYTRLDGLQLTVRDLENNSNALGSVPEVVTKGLEIDTKSIISERWSMTGGLSYTRATFEDFNNATCYSGQLEAQGCVSDMGSNAQDLSGQTLSNAPKWRAVWGLRHNTPLGGYRVYVHANVRAQSEALFDTAGNPKSSQAGYGIVDLSVGVVTDDEAVRGEIFVKNLFDKQYVNGHSINGNAGGDLILHLIPRDFERYIGAKVSFRF